MCLLGGLSWPRGTSLARSTPVVALLDVRAGRRADAESADATQTETTTVRYAPAHPSVFPYVAETTIIVWMDVGATARP